MTWALSHVRYLRALNPYFPICAAHMPELSVRQQFAWTTLDTFDWYSPKYEYAQDHREVGELLRGIGLEDVDTSDGGARARMPQEGPATDQGGAQ